MVIEISLLNIDDMILRVHFASAQSGAECAEKGAHTVLGKRYRPRLNIRDSADLEIIMRNYKSVLRQFRICSSIKLSCRSAGLSHRTLYRKKHIAELQILDKNVFSEVHKHALTNELTSKQLDELCKLKMMEHPLCDKASEMRKCNQLLPVIDTINSNQNVSLPFLTL